MYHLELPGDVIHGDVLLKLSGNREALIENYKGILLYTSEEIVVVCKKMTIRISGCDLHIHYFSGSDMKITGTIQTISYLSDGDICC